MDETTYENLLQLMKKRGYTIPKSRHGSFCSRFARTEDYFEIFKHKKFTDTAVIYISPEGKLIATEDIRIFIKIVLNLEVRRAIMVSAYDLGPKTYSSISSFSPFLTFEFISLSSLINILNISFYEKTYTKSSLEEVKELFGIAKPESELNLIKSTDVLCIRNSYLVGDIIKIKDSVGRVEFAYIQN